MLFYCNQNYSSILYDNYILVNRSKNLSKPCNNVHKIIEKPYSIYSFYEHLSNVEHGAVTAKKLDLQL